MYIVFDGITLLFYTDVCILFFCLFSVGLHVGAFYSAAVSFLFLAIFVGMCFPCLCYCVNVFSFFFFLLLASNPVKLSPRQIESLTTLCLFFFRFAMDASYSRGAPLESPVTDATASTEHVANAVSAAHVSATAHPPASPDNVGIRIPPSVYCFLFLFLFL